MSNTRQVAGGLVIALVSIFLIGASLVSALAENRLLLPLSTATPPPTVSTPAPPGPTLIAATATQPPSATIPPTPTDCQIPDGWQPYNVQEGDTLETLAAATGSSPEAIMAANCIPAAPLDPGSILYLPILPASATATPTPSPTPSSTTTMPAPTGTTFSCTRPPGWITYIVQSGDTLYSLAQAYSTTVYQLQVANCLGSSTYIRAGDELWVPNVATRTPSPTPSFTPSKTATPTSTTAASATPTPTATAPATSTPTQTAPPTSTHTPLPPTDTPSPPPPTNTPTQPAPTSTSSGTTVPH